MNLHNIIYKIIQYLYRNKLLINIIVNLNKIVSRLNITINADNLLLSVKTIDRLVYSLLLKYKLWDRELIRFIKKTVKKSVLNVVLKSAMITKIYYSKQVSPIKEFAGRLFHGNDHSISVFVLHNLLSKSSRYYKDFMPIYKSIVETNTTVIVNDNN